MFLLILFVVAWLLLLSWFVYFLTFGTDSFWEQFDELTALVITALFAGFVSLTSELLALHYRHQEYSAGEAVIFYSSFIVSTGIFVCSGVWALALFIFE